MLTKKQLIFTITKEKKTLNKHSKSQETGWPSLMISEINLINSNMSTEKWSL